MEKPQTLLQRLESTARAQKLEAFSKESLDWFRREAMKISRRKAKRELLYADGDLKRVSTIKIGKMYSYLYDPKTKDDLPYYDNFPLIFVVDILPDGFFGLNMHYLPPKLRAILLDRLMELATSSKRADRVKLQITYSILKNASKLSLFQPCFKRYLYTHIRSKLTEIPSNMWEPVVFLPLADFQKASNAQVWSDSARK